MRPAGLVSLAVAVSLAGRAAPAAAAPATAPAVLYAKDGALWQGHAQGAPRELGKLPPELGAASALAIDGAATVVLVGGAGGWYHAPLAAPADLSAIDTDEPAAPTLGAWRKLPCGAARARLAPDGARVLCASPAGTAVVVELASGARLSRNLPIEHVAIAGAGNDAHLLWTDKQGVWAAALGAGPRGAELGPARRVADKPPRRSFSPSPSGARAMATYEGRSHRGKQVVAQELLFSFALDGKAARRKVMSDARVVSWSADSRWALVQQRERACIVAATGGQYKCWKGFRAEAISADGRFALLAGDRGEDKDAAKPEDKDAAKPDAKGPAKPDAKDAAKDAAVAPRPTPAPGDDRVALPGDDEEADEPDDGSGDDESNESGEGGEEQNDDLEHTASGSTSHAPERHLYRAALEGAFTAAPQRIVADFRGPSVFWPARK